MKFSIFLSLVVACFCMIAPLTSAEKRTELPAEAFYQLPLAGNVRVSPNGRYLAILKNVGSKTQVLTYDIQTAKSGVSAVSDNIEYRINWIEWANNEKLLMSLRFEKKHKKTKKKQVYKRLFSIDAHKQSRPVAMIKLKKGAKFTPKIQDNVIGFLPDDPSHFLLSVDLETPYFPSVYKVNVNTGKMTLLKRSVGGVISWLADRNGVLRVRTEYDDSQRKITLKVLRPGEKKWELAWEYVQLDEPEVKPLGFSNNANELFIIADFEGRGAVYKVDLSKPGFNKTLVYSSKKRDVNGKLISVGKDNTFVGMYLSGGSIKSIFWDETFQAFQKGLDKVLPNSRNFIVSMSHDAKTYVLRVKDNVTPGAYYVGNRDEKSLYKLFDLYPELTADVLVRKEKRTYKARDGLSINGFLSLPKDFKKSPAATIILPHGGPIAKSWKGYDKLSAFLANRGYVVFQPNFRGSTGVGHKFAKKALGAFGQAMQDDLEDAVSYLVKNRIADPERVCIVGASYGGYAALMGVVKTPDLYKCAISYAGLSDLKMKYDSARFASNKNVVLSLIGKDKKILKEFSPLRQAEKIKVPILLIHGTDDVVVPFEHSEKMAKKLAALGKTHELVVLDDGNHNMNYLPARKATFEAMESFLDKYLPIK